MNWIKNKILSFVQKTKDRFSLLFKKVNKLKDFGIRPNKDMNEKITKDLDN